MRGFIVGTVATAIAFWIVAVVFPEYLGLDFLTYEGDIVGLLVLALIFGVINGLIGPIVRLIAEAPTAAEAEALVATARAA